MTEFLCRYRIQKYNRAKSRLLFGNSVEKYLILILFEYCWQNILKMLLYFTDISSSIFKFEKYIFLILAPSRISIYRRNILRDCLSRCPIASFCYVTVRGQILIGLVARTLLFRDFYI